MLRVMLLAGISYMAHAQSVVPTSFSPEQVHLALGSLSSTMSVAWATQSQTSAEVFWGSEASTLPNTAKGDTRAFTQDAGRTWFTHTALITGLVPGQSYYYKVGSLGNYSEVFNFTNRPLGAPYKHVIFGDLGAACAFSQCPGCTAKSTVCDESTCAANTSVGLVSEIAGSSMFLQLGDFAYNLDSNDGKTGDQFMRNIQQFAARVPFMVNHGNHEDSAGALAHYIERFRSQPSNAVPPTFKSANGETTNTMYFSWDSGLVHYISVSTELWFGVGDGQSNTSTFLKWAEADLEAANKNRAAVPWIIMQGHRSVYCSCDGDCDGDAKIVRQDVEPILFKYGVDFFINGHEHNYERSYPVYQAKSDRSNVNPKATIYIVSGSAGNTEMHEPFTRIQPTWSAYRSNTFGYSRMFVHNATHLHWQQIQTDPTDFPESDYGRVIDDAWIIQETHGPFDAAQAPKGEAFPTSDSTNLEDGRQYDHWWPLLDLEDHSGRRTEVIIDEFRKTHGEQAWVEKLEGLRHWMQRTMAGDKVAGEAKGIHQGLVWEDVRDDGSSDGAVFKWKDSHA